MEGEIGVLQVEKKIRNRVKRQMEKTQREYYLNEQMKAIQKELGETEDGRDEISELEKRIKKTQALQGGAREGQRRAEEAAHHEPDVGRGDGGAQLPRLAAVDPVAQADQDHQGPRSTPRTMLDADHYGLEKVKERILEYLAVQQRVDKMKGPILCLVGPPGVGKTSLGKSIAKATGRNFVRMSLGGVRDEAEIRGHRRTYIGSLPGKVIQSMKKAKSSNPLFLLDEIDKLGADFRGDPVVGAARGARPRAELDLQRPLPRGRLRPVGRDVHHHGQHAAHAAAAAGPHGDHPARRLHRGREGRRSPRKHLIPKQIEAHGLKDGESTITDDGRARPRSATTRARPASATSSARSPTSPARRVKEILMKGTSKVKITRRRTSSKYAGVRRFRYGEAELEDLVGVTTGLAWTEVGGELLRSRR